MQQFQILSDAKKYLVLLSFEYMSKTFLVPNFQGDQQANIVYIVNNLHCNLSTVAADGSPASYRPSNQITFLCQYFIL